jgi:hypothetical protein
MSEFDIDAFLAELDRLGVRLTALRLADGKLYRWRMRGARDNARAEGGWPIPMLAVAAGENDPVLRRDVLGGHDRLPSLEIAIRQARFRR